MMRFSHILKAYCAVLLSLLFLGCSRPASQNIPLSDNRYARGFALIPHTDYTEAVVLDPWQPGRIMQRYWLVPDSLPDVQTPSDGVRVTVPVRRMAVNSCTHIGFLSPLDKLHTVVAVCDPSLVYTPLPDSGYVDMGNNLQLSVERLLLAKPDALMLSTYAQNDAQRDLLQQAGIPVIYNNEWTEIHPLARAEWLRFVAAFYGEEALADSLFQKVVEDYNALAQLVMNRTERPVVLPGGNFRGTWYVPSGKSYMGRLFVDAGADYPYAADTSATSLPLSLETVLMRFQEADVWVGASARTLQELADLDEKHTCFSAFRQGKVYNFLKRTTPSGGNDFWETGVVRPDMILADLIKVLYPELLPDYELCFIDRLP